MSWLDKVKGLETGSIECSESSIVSDVIVDVIGNVNACSSEDSADDKDRAFVIPLNQFDSILHENYDFPPTYSHKLGLCAS